MLPDDKVKVTPLGEIRKTSHSWAMFGRLDDDNYRDEVDGVREFLLCCLRLAAPLH